MNTHDKIVKCRSCDYVGPCDPTCCEHPDYDGATAEEAWQAAIEADRKRRGEPFMYLRTLNGKPDWSEDCISDCESDLIHDEEMYAEGYGVMPLYTAPEPIEPTTSNSTELEEAVEPVKMRPETDSEHIARDIREGRFPDKSDRKMVPAEPLNPSVSFDDPRVQQVYEIICGDNHPPAGEHWDGYVSRLIVNWYAAHRANGGDPDPVAEDLLAEVRAEDAAGQHISHAPGRA